MTCKQNCFILLGFLFSLLSSPIIPSLHATESVVLEEYDEVSLVFRYGNSINTNVIAFFNGEQFLLPVSEMFSLLRIVQNVNTGIASINGYFIDEDRTYRIDFLNKTIRYNNRNISLSQEDVYICDLDFYLSQSALESIFGLEFIVEFNTLTMRLVTTEKMPVTLILERTARRSQMMSNLNVIPDYDLKFPRNRNRLNGSFLDYSINKTLSENFFYSQVFNVGAEVLGGDFQGSHSLFHSTFGTDTQFSKVRLRYTWLDNPAVTQLFLGELSTEGIIAEKFYGIKMTNDPILPRRTFDTYRYSGQTQPQSEVEVYLNNRLIDFQIADEFGNYNSDIPLTFGTSDLRIVSISPGGEIKEETRNFQIPFTFLPKNELVYFINAGVYERMQFPSTALKEVYQGAVSYGVSRSFTVKTGLDIIQEEARSALWYSQFNFRLYDQYLISTDISPGNYYRYSGSVLYPNGTSFNITGTEYSDTGLFNRSALIRTHSGTMFLPFYQTKIPVGLRYSFDFIDFENGDTWRHFVEMNYRLGRLNVRTGYRQNIFVRGNSRSYNGRVVTSATYTVSRGFNVPSYLRGTFIRGQFDYNIDRSMIEFVDLQISNQIIDRGRLDLSFSRNMIFKTNQIQVGFTVDFNFARSVSRARMRGNTYTFSHNMRGSVGYDETNNYFFTDFRQQVGRSGAAFRMYVDENSNGIYDEGEEIIDDPAIRIRRANTNKLGRDGVFRFTQLQQYDRYNVEINTAALSNPTLVTSQKRFSFIADPNQFKRIDIPFYYSGVIEGQINISDGQTVTGIGGLRLYLESVETGIIRELRTFADGYFYEMEVEPGKYKLYVDPNQLLILRAVSTPEVLEFEVQISADGDFVDGLEITLQRTGQ